MGNFKVIDNKVFSFRVSLLFLVFWGWVDHTSYKMP
jgi:hypothetical protein